MSPSPIEEAFTSRKELCEDPTDQRSVQPVINEFFTGSDLVDAMRWMKKQLGRQVTTGGHG